MEGGGVRVWRCARAGMPHLSEAGHGVLVLLVVPAALPAVVQRVHAAAATAAVVLDALILHHHTLAPSQHLATATHTHTHTHTHTGERERGERELAMGWQAGARPASRAY